MAFHLFNQIFMLFLCFDFILFKYLKGICLLFRKLLEGFHLIIKRVINTLLIPLNSLIEPLFDSPEYFHFEMFPEQLMLDLILLS